MQKLREESITWLDDVWLVTGNVQSFYTNVPINETVEEISQSLGSRKFDGISMDILYHLLMIVMKCNLFEFDGTLYY